jgi:hypothetical protein
LLILSRIFAGTDAEWNEIIKSASNDDSFIEEEEEVPTLIADVSTILETTNDDGFLTLLKQIKVC